MGKGTRRRRLRRAATWWSAWGLALLAGCATGPGRLTEGETVSFDGQEYSLRRVDRATPGILSFAAGWLQHPELGLLPIHAETADAWWVRIATVEASPASDRPGDGAMFSVETALTPEGRLLEFDTGLPREGQWRRCLQANHERYSTTLFAPPARKGPPDLQRWHREPGGWRAEPVPLPGIALDYGCINVADYDGDGRADLALAMHLHRFAAWLGDPGGGYQDAFAGLPSLRAGAGPQGSGIALASLRQQDGDRLLLLREATGVISDRLAPGLAEYRWDGQRWLTTSIAETLTGSGLTLDQSPPCAPLLAVESSGNNNLPLYERSTDVWRSVALPDFDSRSIWFVTALSLGDADGRGCSDLAVARRVNRDGEWTTQVDLWTRDRGPWQRKELINSEARAAVTALQLGSPTTLSGHLLIGDQEGNLDLFAVQSTAARWIGRAEAGGWREGCSVSAITALEIDATSPRWVVALAGESDLFAPQRCASGGGLLEVGWEASTVVAPR